MSLLLLLDERRLNPVEVVVDVRAETLLHLVDVGGGGFGDFPAGVEDGKGVQHECAFAGVEPFVGFPAGCGFGGEEGVGFVVGLEDVSGWVSGLAFL